MKNSTTINQVQVGMGLLVIRDGKVLVGKRKGSHAAGLYSFPGGHLDYGETWENCVQRELIEECGDRLKVEIVPYDATHKEFFVTNDIMPQYGKHYITIFMVAKWIEGEAENMEPEKCEGWEWVDYNKLCEISKIGDCATWIPMNLISSNLERIGL